MTSRSDPSLPSIAVKLLGGLALAAVGAVTGYSLVDVLEGRSWSDSLAVVMAVALIAVGVLSAITLVLRPSTVPRGCGLLQVVVLMLAGLLFLAPMYAPASVSPDVVFAGIVVILGIQTVANLMLWRAADEMLRRVMADTSVIAFWVLQTALFLYAAAERLGLVATISGWGLIGILMAVYLVASIAASARRGIH
ncbi:hypothetical protein BZG35_03350 [Brevundimonas sp. LM2]|uniref:hypothetical protein n=1 Tax=Brevundimonas sp. LM2 TaxID=1938605 RepID=UPI000983BECB|nr:hypothetical protein [Brevundimonas sp. LM2]AQR60795.1 hypothetical protein BZG35_03350 [Brevundimonas sp. LM2]